MKASDFGNDFKWGVSTSAYQIEGAHNLYGKGSSIWDEFSNQKGKVKNQENGNVACDFYHKYEEDILLLKQLGIRNFRFSISWSRILPEGKGLINYQGIRFYNNIIDFCLKHDIEPWITLYHWDLPTELQKRGGWTNREILNWFQEYVSICVRCFGDRVKKWIVLNEPLTFTGAGYFLGMHAPGKRGMKNFIPALHHASLCQAEGGRIIKSIRSDCEVGTTFSNSHIEPYNHNSRKDIEAAHRADALFNRVFLEPSLGLGYPLKELKFLNRIEDYLHPNDEKKLAFDFDFIGVQVYTREIIKHSYFVPYINAKIYPAHKRPNEVTQMSWEVYPESIYHVLKKLKSYNKKIYVTENGAAFKDYNDNGVIEDLNRKNFIKNHIKEILKAKNEGVNVQGYFVWSLLDNFEWAMGYTPRFGIVHVNFKTLKRTVKHSGKWYSSFISQS